MYSSHNKKKMLPQFGQMQYISYTYQINIDLSSAIVVYDFKFIYDKCQN